MGLWFLMGIGFVLFLIVSIIKPWIHGGSIRDLEFEVRKLKAQLLEITSYLQSKGMEVPKQAPPAQTPAEIYTPAVAPVMAPDSPPVQMPEPPKPQPVQPKIQREAAPKKRISFEQQFGARLPVWVGGIALALAGFYLVKYSIEVGLLTPAMRTFIGGIFGLGLMAAAHWIGARPIANSGRIAQSLAGAAIADLYIVLFAATSLYHILPPFVGFIGMAMVTATAVVLSLRHGAPIALMGMVGGFLTPALVSSNEPNAPLLFIYLYFVLTGLFVVIRKRNWWGLSIPAVIGAFAGA
jgi:uncharacterized membrane protein